MALLAMMRRSQARGRAGQGRQRGLGHLEQLAGGGALVHTLAVDGLVDGERAHGAVAAGSHALHVAPGAEALAGAGQHDALHIVVELGRGQLVLQRLVHGPGHGVACLRAVQRQRQHAGVQRGQQILGAGVDGGAHGLVSSLSGVRNRRC
jgi:hypothetical protein